MISEALTELYLYDMKIRKKDEHGEPALANMIIPANAKYETAAMEEYLATAAKQSTGFSRTMNPQTTPRNPQTR